MEAMNDPYSNKFKNITKEERKVSEYSPFYESWQLKAVIVKANDDIRQEVLAIQLMKRLKQIFIEGGVNTRDIYLRPYEIFVTGQESGLIEFVPDTNSIDYLKKKFRAKCSNEWTLNTFYRNYWKDSFSEAQLNFVRSFAGYAIFTYLFNVKDRHNGNILIDATGHIVHIDFGFYL